MSDCRDFDIWLKANSRAGLSGTVRAACFCHYLQIFRLCWGSGLWKAQITRIVPIVYCRLPLIWKASMKSGQKPLPFPAIAAPLAICAGRGINILLAQKNHYIPAGTGRKHIICTEKNNIRYLLYFQINNALSLSNVPKPEYKWHPRFNSGVPAR